MLFHFRFVNCSSAEQSKFLFCRSSHPPEYFTGKPSLWFERLRSLWVRLRSAKRKFSSLLLKDTVMAGKWFYKLLALTEVRKAPWTSVLAEQHCPGGVGGTGLSGAQPCQERLLCCPLRGTKGRLGGKRWHFLTQMAKDRKASACEAFGARRGWGGEALLAMLQVVHCLGVKPARSTGL